MSERWAVELVEAMRGKAESEGQTGLMFAKVNTEQPITLLAHDQVVSKNLHINESLTLRAGDQVLVLQSGTTFYILLKVVPL